MGMSIRTDDAKSADNNNEEGVDYYVRYTPVHEYAQDKRNKQVNILFISYEERQYFEKLFRSYQIAPEPKFCLLAPIVECGLVDVSDEAIYVFYDRKKHVARVTKNYKIVYNETREFDSIGDFAKSVKKEVPNVCATRDVRSNKNHFSISECQKYANAFSVGYSEKDERNEKILSRPRLNMSTLRRIERSLVPILPYKNDEPQECKREEFVDESDESVSELRAEKLVLDGCTSLISPIFLNPKHLSLKACTCIQSIGFVSNLIEFLNVSYCETLLGEQMEHLIKASPHLKTLYMVGCSLPTIVIESKTLQKVFVMNSELARIQVSCETLKVLDASQSASLRHLQIDAKSIESLNLDYTRCFEYELDHLKLLLVLSMSHTGNVPRIDEFLLLQVLDLSQNEICDEKAIKIAGAISNFDCLKELYLSQNQITQEGAKAIANSIKDSLEVLDLSQNQIGDQGAIQISRLISELQVLHLSHNQITSNAVRAIASGVGTNLRELYLSDNFIDEEAINFLLGSRAIHLEKLDLSSNSIGQEGGEAIKKAFVNLKELSFYLLLGAYRTNKKIN